MRASLWRDEDGLVSLNRLGPRLAAVVLAAVAALVAASLVVVLTARPPPAGVAPGSDLRLYGDLVQDVAKGASYYAAAPRELRHEGFPLRPFLAVRPPLLTVSLAALPSEPARRAALAALALAVWTAWAWRLRPLCRGEPLRCAWALVLAAAGPGVALAPAAYLFHETWAGLLIALSLAMRRPGAWRASVIVGLAAALVRELAFPYVATMALFAALERRRGEALGWIAALALASAALAGHAAAVAAVTSPADIASPGWLGVGGLGFLLRLSHVSALTIATPLIAQALILPAALLGLLFWSDPAPSGAGRRLAFLVFGYLAGFAVMGRSDNDYWGLMIAPLWPLGLLNLDRVAAGLLGKLRVAPARSSHLARSTP
jgi:hypothetical protein